MQNDERFPGLRLRNGDGRIWCEEGAGRIRGQVLTIGLPAVAFRDELVRRWSAEPELARQVDRLAGVLVQALRGFANAEHGTSDHRSEALHMVEEARAALREYDRLPAYLDPEKVRSAGFAPDSDGPDLEVIR